MSVFGSLTGAAVVAQMYPDSVTFSPPDPGDERHGDVLLLLQAGTSYPASVTLTSTRAGGRETHELPEGEQVVQVLTPVDPGVHIHWHCLWDGKVLVVQGAALAHAFGGPYRTWCKHVE